MPTTRSSRRASSTSASPNTVVYCGGAAGAAFADFSGSFFFGAAAGPYTIEPRFPACHLSLPSRPPSSAGAEALPLTGFQCTTTGPAACSAPPLPGGREAFPLHVFAGPPPGGARLQPLPDRGAKRLHVGAVDPPHVGEVEPLEEEAGGPVGF